MARTGKISTIKKDQSGKLQTMEKSLANKGYTRIPGTGSFKFPYKELDGKYRTGLDPNAAYIKRIVDPTAQELEIKRVTELKQKLESIFNVDLSPTSQFWDYSKSTGTNDSKHVQPVKLMDGDNLFDLSNPQMELMFAWLRVHPTIASSYQAWQTGQFPAETQYYVVDDEIENTIKFNKKQEINKAVLMFQNMTPTTRKKIARQLGLPVTEETTEEVVYNLVDDVLKQSDFKTGKHVGQSPIRVFLQYATMKEDLLHVKDLVKQAIMHSVYRIKSGGKVFRGDYELAKSEDDLVKFLMDEDNQEDLLQLEQDLKHKKLAAV